MKVRYSASGIPYLAGAGENVPAAPPRQPASPVRRILLFLAVFVALQTLWAGARGSAVEHLLIDTATVRPAAALVHLLTPELDVRAIGTRLVAAGGGINILNGCEGLEALFLLAAAFAVADLSWRRRMAGLALGAVLVYLINQARIVGLFYANRMDRALFDQLHGTAGPLLLVVLVGLYFFAWLHRAATTDAAAAQRQTS